MWFVKVSIPGEKFVDAMSAVSGWLDEQAIDAPNFSYSRDSAGEIKFRISFQAAADADRFARRFDGRVLPPDRPGD